MNRFCLLPLVYCLISECQSAIYVVETVKSNASFEVGYFGHGKVKGVLTRLSGSVELDNQTRQGSGDIVFDMTVVETGSSITNRFIKSGSVFDTEKYPTMMFRATRFDYEGERLLAVNGDLNLHGAIKAIRLEAKQFACTEAPEGLRQQCQGEFSTIIYRSHFGMNRFRFLVDDEVLINVSLALERVQP